MKSDELMIGDWVVYNGDVEYTNPIKIEGMDIATDMLITSDREDVGFEGVGPIPLTKDILNQNFDFHTIPSDGIHSKDEFWLLVEKPKRVWLHQYATSVFVQIATKDEYGCECRLLQIKVLHVHELQHALRLCGIDKEIEL